MDERFWQLCDELVESNTIEIDRPKGSRHPKWSLVYPMDYGFFKAPGATTGPVLTSGAAALRIER